MSRRLDYSGETILNSKNLRDICHRAEEDLDGGRKYHHPETFYSSSSSSLPSFGSPRERSMPQTAGERNYLYRNLRSNSKFTNESTSGRTQSSRPPLLPSPCSRPPLLPSPSRVQPYPHLARPNRGPDNLFGDTNLGLTHSRMSFSSRLDNPRLSKEGFEYTAPPSITSPSPRSRAAQPRASNEEVVMEEKSPAACASPILQRKPLNRSRWETTATQKSHRPQHIPYRDLLSMAVENTQTTPPKRPKLTLMRKQNLSRTSYQKEVENYALKSAPPKLKEQSSRAEVKTPPLDKEVNEMLNTNTSIDTGDDGCSTKPTTDKGRSYSLRKRKTVKSDDTLLLKYQPEGCKMAVELTHSDVDTLKPGEFLNDKIMDFYLKYIMFELLKEELRPRLHIFSSFFYTRLCNSSMDDKSLSISMDERMHNRVKTWTRHVDLFGKDYIVMPICDRSHWYVILIQNPGQFDHLAAAAAAAVRVRTAPKKHKKRLIVKRKSKRVQSKMPAIDLSSQGGRVTSEEDEETVDVVGLGSDNQQGAEGLIPTGKKDSSKDPLHVMVYEDEENQGIMEDGKISPVPSASSSTSTSSYASCYAVLPPLEKLQPDPGIGMWEGSPSNTITPSQSTSCLLSTPPLGGDSRRPLTVSVSSCNSDVMVMQNQGSRQPWVDVGDDEGSLDNRDDFAQGLLVPLSSETSMDLTALDSDADSISRNLAEDSDEATDEVNSIDTDGLHPVKVKEEEDDSSLEPCIMVLDSLGIRRPSTVRKVRKYLSREWVVKKDKSVDDKFEHLRVYYPKIPLQHNSSDCGVYVLQFIETLVQCLNASKHLPSTTDKWGTAKVVNKRNELSQLIFNLVQLSSSSTNKNQS